MSGVGKSSVLEELQRRGHAVADTDYDGLSRVDETGDWVWNEPRIESLLAEEQTGLLFVSGTAPNMGRFLPSFDHVILLSVAAETMAHRLATRTNNPYGQRPDEIEESLHYKETVEPLLRKIATIEIDTSPPLPDVVDAVLRHVTAST